MKKSIYLCQSVGNVHLPSLVTNTLSTYESAIA